MKTCRRLPIIAVAAAILLSPVSLRSQSTQSEANEDIKWRIEVTDFGTSYSIPGCTVAVSKDEREIYIIAKDDSYHSGLLTQIIRITRENLSISKDEHWVIERGGRYIFLYEQPYDVFFVKYLKAVQELPKRVRQAFGGHYGPQMR